MDTGIALAGLLVGVIVGLAGMGGGALMTPILVFLFRIDPLTVTSGDVVLRRRHSWSSGSRPSRARPAEMEVSE
nr:hypothetical protein [Propionicimonas sp.]